MTTQDRTSADVCHCRHPRHYHLNAAGASPLEGDGIGACMVTRCGCTAFQPIGAPLQEEPERCAVCGGHLGEEGGGGGADPCSCPQDAIDWPDLEDHPLARDAIAMLTFDYDKVRIERHPPMGALRWRVELWALPRCDRCEGTGFEPNGRPGRCKKCEGVGRDPWLAEELKKTVIVHADGRIRPEGAGR